MIITTYIYRGFRDDSMCAVLAIRTGAAGAHQLLDAIIFAIHHDCELAQQSFLVREHLRQTLSLSLELSKNLILDLILHNQTEHW